MAEKFERLRKGMTRERQKRNEDRAATLLAIIERAEAESSNSLQDSVPPSRSSDQ